jgi:hypothetical protein
VGPLVPGPSYHEVETAIAKLKKHKFPRSDQIPAELIQAGGETLVSVIHKLINSIQNKDEQPHQRKESSIVPIHKKNDKTDCNNYHNHYQFHTKCYEISFFHGKSIYRWNYWGPSVWILM